MIIVVDEFFVENPLVSVVIPSYNRSETVAQTIGSIVNQKCDFAFEIIIGDDCSTDNARQVLLEYQKKYPTLIKLLFYEQNIGLGANWATCVKHCRGKYLANCDNDDYWHNPNKLQFQVDFLETNLEYGVVHTDFRNHNRITGKIQEVKVSDKELIKPLQLTIFTGKYQFCNATMMYRKELIDKYIHLEDYIKHQFTLQDWNTWVILAKYTEFYCLPLSTATFGVETDSITRPATYDKIISRFNKEKECYRYVCGLFPTELIYNENAYDIYVNSVLLNLAYKRAEYKQVRKIAKIMYGLGDNSLRTSCSKCYLGFLLLFIFKFLRQ